MQETQPADSENNANPQPPKPLRLRWLFFVLGFVVGLLLAVTWRLDEISERAKFAAQNGFSALALIVIAVQAVIYYRQREVMAQQWQAMSGQLKAIRKQELHLRVQAKAALKAADMAMGQLVAMQSQERAQYAALEETRKIVAQNERAIKASEDTAKTARDAFYVGEAPYFGVVRMVWLDFDIGYSPQLVMEFMNGGKTPAWLFYAQPTVIYGDSPEEGEHWNLKPVRDDLVNSFIPSNESREMKFTEHTFRYTAEMRAHVEAESAHLFVVVTLTYRDFRKRDHKRVLKYVWHRRHLCFSDYETTNETYADEGDSQNPNRDPSGPTF